MREKLKNLIYLLFLLFFLISINELSIVSHKLRTTTYGIPVTSLLNYLIFMLLGFILSLECLKIREKGTLIKRIDFFKFTFIVLPLSTTLMIKCLSYSGSFALPSFMMNLTETFYMVISCILGFTIPISLYFKE